MKTLEVLSEYDRKLVYCEGDRELNQASYKGCRFSFPGDTENPPGCNPVQAAVDCIVSM